MRSMRPSSSARGASIGWPPTKISIAAPNADEPWKALTAFGSGDDAQVHFGLSHAGGGDGDAKVTGHRQFESAPKGRSVHRHDDRLLTVFDCCQKVVDIGSAGRSLTRRDSFQFPDVRSRDEGSAGADDDDGADPRVGAGFIDRPPQAVRDRLAECVDWGVVYGDDGNVVPTGQAVQDRS